MESHDIFEYQDTMARATRDIHAACPGVELSVLWDDGHIGMVTATHRVKIWNGLGTAEFQIAHDEVLEGGDAYHGFLAVIAVTAFKKMKV